MSEKSDLEDGTKEARSACMFIYTFTPPNSFCFYLKNSLNIDSQSLFFCP